MTADAKTLFNVERIRGDFPLIHDLGQGERPLTYLDNAATTQKPQRVIQALEAFYSAENANIHRGVHALSQRATEAYDHARETIARFINARESAEIIFTRGTTEAINLVANSLVRPRLKPGSNIVLTMMEHHANIVPWQILAGESDLEIRVTPIDERGVLDLEAFAKLVDENTVLASFVHVSNALGTINPVGQMIGIAHEKGVTTLLDGAQSVAHFPVDVQALGCDFFAFSGHKIYGPTGIGVLYGRGELLRSMPPYQGGGDMIRTVSWEKTTYKDIPDRFEAGTPNIAGAIGLGAAIEYLRDMDFSAAAQWEADVLKYAHEAVIEIDGVSIVGNSPDKASVLSFLIEGVHPHDIGTFLDADNIAIRAGHHCAQPLMRHLGIPGTARASFTFYNTREEVDRLVAGLRKIVRFFGS